MRRLLPASLLFLFVFSCTSDPDTVTGHDSVKGNDTMITRMDTFHVDSGSTSTTYYNCSVLNKKIPADTEQNEIRTDLTQLIHCGIDSFDFLYVVPNLFPGYASENQVAGKKVTYGDFVKHVNEFKTTPAYQQLHERVQTLDSLRGVKFDHAKIYMMKPVLGKLGFTEPEWEMFSGFANSYESPKKGRTTWGDILDAFDKYRPDR